MLNRISKLKRGLQEKTGRGGRGKSRRRCSSEKRAHKRTLGLKKGERLIYRIMELRRKRKEGKETKLREKRGRKEGFRCGALNARGGGRGGGRGHSPRVPEKLHDQFGKGDSGRKCEKEGEKGKNISCDDPIELRVWGE